MNYITQVVVDAVLLWGLYALMAVPLCLTFGVMRIVNFAHGEFVMLGAYAAYGGFTLLGVDPLLSLPIIMPLGALLGYIIFKIVVERALMAPRLNQMLLMFGLGLALQNIALILWSADGRSVLPSYAISTIEFSDILIPTGRLYATCVAVGLVVALFCWLHYSETGRALQAVSQNRDASILMGINPRHINEISFSLASALTAATGATVSFFLTINPFMGFVILVKSVAIVILGGVGSLSGTVLAAGVLALTETVVSYYVFEGSGWAEGAAFGPLLLILILRPGGLIGQAVEQ
jgi:branched-chain amino acid transport system permease protein